jgi:hypothetical protein
MAWGMLTFACGAGVVLLVFTVPYFDSRAIGALVNGVLLRSQHRLHVQSSVRNGPDLIWTGFSIPLAYALVRAKQDTRPAPPAVWILIAFWIAADVASFARVPGTLVWLSVRMLMLPLAALIALHLWDLSSSGEQASHQSRRLVLVTCVAAWCGLVQFPFAYQTYFAYVAPVVILAAMALAAVNRRPSPIIRLVTLSGYCVFALIMRRNIYPERLVDSGELAELRLPRGGILVPAGDALQYEAVAALLNEHSRSRFTLATPDLPEVYFLSGLENPTRTFFEGYDYPPSNPLDVLKKVDEHGITAIVINHHPVFSSPLPAALEDSLMQRFPEARSVGPFEVRWQR